MTLDDFTIKGRDAIHIAQATARRHEQALVDVPHLLKGLLDTESSSVLRLLKNDAVDIDELRASIDKMIEDSPKGPEGAKQRLTRAANQALIRAKKALPDFKDKFISPELMLLGILTGATATASLLRKQGLTPAKLIQSIKKLRKNTKITDARADAHGDSLQRYASNLNEEVRHQPPAPIAGREDELRNVLQILTRQRKNNILLVGESGVGKADIIRTLADRINRDEVPAGLQNQTLYSLDIPLLLADAKYKGEFEGRFKALLSELAAAGTRSILFVNDFHQLLTTGGGGGSLNAAGLMFPALRRGDIRVIGLTTPDEYRKYLEKNSSLTRFFQIIHIEEASIEETISILRGLRQKLENYHRVAFRDEALVAAARLSQRYNHEKFLPEKAIDLLDEAGAMMRLELDSVPGSISDLRQKVQQLVIEIESIDATHNGKTKKQLNAQLASAKKQLDTLTQQWQREKELIHTIQTAKERIEKLEKQSVAAEQEGNFDLVSEIQYKKIEAELKKITKAEKALHALPEEERLIRDEVTRDDIARIVAQRTGIPVSRMMDSERDKLLRLEEEIGKSLIGQKQAVKAVADAVRRNRSGLQPPGRPIGSFIFLGPTGVGKTQLAKTLANVLFDDEKAIIRLDMSEFQESHQVSRLIGAPPGYVGYDEGGQLTEAVRRQPYAIVLLDEIEKAHADVYNLLLQVLDDGRLTDNKGRVADFSNTIIIMTSNLGADVILENFEDLEALGEKHFEKIIKTTENEVFQLLKEKMPPEFLNRIDEKIMFRPLSKKEIREIMHLMLRTTVNMLSQKDIQISLSKRAEHFLTEKGYDPKFGARPMKRAIQKELVNPLATELIAGRFKAGDHIWVEEKGGKLTFSHKRKK